MRFNLMVWFNKKKIKNYYVYDAIQVFNYRIVICVFF